MVIACLFGVVSVASIRQSVVMVASLFSLAFVWSPSIQLFTFRSTDGRYVGRQRGCFVFMLVKIMCIGIFIIFVIMMQTRGSITICASLIVEGFQMLPNMVMLRWVLINCLTGITAHMLSYCSASYCLSHVGMTLPSILSTPIAIGVTIYSCLTGYFLHASASVCSSSEEIWIAFGLAILAWIIPFVTLRHRYCKKTKILLTPMEEMFLSYGWNNVFSDQHMSLSYRPEGFTPYDRCVLDEDNKKSRIFICTTMYHEADYEMERLLLSLQRLSLSTKLKDVYLEAHVVLDNGAKDCNLTEFALQLISLLQSKLEVDKMDSVAQQTPYGLQLHWILPGGMPFFIHLKDVSKAKAKKRWSQILYMRYLMEHRIQKSSEWLQRQAEGLYDTPMYIGYSARDEADTARRQSKVSHHHHHNYEKALLSRIRSILTKSETTESLETLDAKDYLSALDSTEITPTGSSILKRKGSLGSSDQGIDTGDEISSISTDEYPQSKNSSTKYTAGSNSLSVSSYSSVQEEFGLKNIAYEADSMVENGANNENGDSKNLGYVNIYDGINNGTKPMKTPDNIVIPTISLTVDLEHQPPSLEYDDQTYILATDADMEFDDNSVKELLETCNRDLRLGGACGRTRPIGKTNGPIVWFQMFEYAKGEMVHPYFRVMQSSFRVLIIIIIIFIV